VIPLDQELEERSMEIIRKTEDIDKSFPVNCGLAGKRVLHAIFGEGKVIGTPREGEGVIVQFDTMVTPRTFGPSAKLVYIS